MAVRIGVDVGGTFTKAVACDPSGRVVARSSVPTTHGDAGGVAAGVVLALRHVATEVRERELGPIALVAHSTTQAVNALLEGDTATVGIVGVGRRPDSSRARRRTRVGAIALAPGHELRTHHVFLDATDGLDRQDVSRALQELEARGAQAVCISEAFGVDDARIEWLGLEVAEDRGLAACAGHELSGLYGLEMRTVTAALNASILPAAVATAATVARAVEAEAAGAPVVVMRGDGGAAAIEALRRRPLLTAFSGPAASVCGAIRSSLVHDGVVIEVGGTSTNVSTVVGGRPVLSYVRVLGHVTCVRSLDVRVVGVGGGSLVRLGRRGRVVDVGPRSAHIAGLTYASFAGAGDLTDARVRLISPRPDDPSDYVVLETPDGHRYAPTVTCAANALGAVPAGTYACADPAAAREAFEILGRTIGADAQTLAMRVVDLAAGKVAAVVDDAVRASRSRARDVVGVGGGAGALVPVVADRRDARWSIPPDAEVISSIGDALSLVRIELEESLPEASAPAIAELHRRARDAARAAGAEPSGIQVESHAVPEKRAMRVTATGAVALTATSGGEDLPLAPDRLAEIARGRLGDDAALVLETGFYSLFAAGPAGRQHVVVMDRHGTIAFQGEGTLLTGSGREVAAAVQERVDALARRYGPIRVAPAIRILQGAALTDLSLVADPEKAADAACLECETAAGPVAAFLSRS